MAGETGGAWVRFRVQLEPTSRVPEGALIKPFVRVSAFSSTVGDSSDGRNVIGNYSVKVETSQRAASGPSPSIEQSFNILIRSAVQAAAGRVWVAVHEELAEEASPSRPGRSPGRVTGALFGSIRIQLDEDGLGASIGSVLDYGAHLEFGTRQMPARPFLNPALERSKRAILNIIEQAASAAVGAQGSASAERELEQGSGDFEAYEGIAVLNFQESIRGVSNRVSPILDALLELSKPSRKSEDYTTGVR